MNRVIMIYAKSKREFDEFVGDCADLRPFIENELDRLKKSRQGYSPKAIAMRRFLYSSENWREPDKSRDLTNQHE